MVVIDEVQAEVIPAPHRSRLYVQCAVLSASLAILPWLPGCFVERAGTSGSDGGDIDSGADAATGCAPGFVDLDGVDGCECEIMPEQCNGGDDDCDRVMDEGTAATCGDPAICTGGTQECVGGALGACVPDVATELCGNMMDDDCDMMVDEGCDCDPVGSSEDCESDVGECMPGRRTCLASGWGPCEGAVGPGMESCNNLDDDCDNSTDESLARGCGTDVGECSTGMETCSGGSYGGCTAVGPGPAELCDVAGNDEDCDGMRNEGCACVEGETRSCPCSGLETCDLTGTFGTCVPGAPGTETCNGLDDDCDGTTDEGTTCGSCTHRNRGTRSYLFCFSLMLNWDAAQAHCTMFGGGYDLVTVEDAGENNWLNERERVLDDRNQNWWYGATDRAVEGTFLWEPTLMTMVYEDWDLPDSEPDGGSSENCVSNENRAMPEWSTNPCTDEFRFVCEDQDS